MSVEYTNEFIGLKEKMMKMITPRGRQKIDGNATDHVLKLMEELPSVLEYLAKTRNIQGQSTAKRRAKKS